MRLLFLIFPSIIFSQNITITVKEYSTKKPIENAIILSRKKEIALTDKNGIATFSNTKLIQIVAAGFDTTEIQLGNLNQTVYLSRMEKKLKEVKIKPVLDTFANSLIQRMIDNFAKNHPDKSSNYKFYIYSKIVIDVLEDSIKKFQKASDSDLTNFIKHSKIFVWEKLSEAKHDIRYGQKKTVLTSNMSGFKEPIYELIAVSLEDINYLPWIFREKKTKEYIFRFEDSIIWNGRKAYEVNFFPQKKFKSKRSRSGFVHIDSTTSAMIKYYGNTSQGFFELEKELVDGFCFTKYMYFKSSNGVFGSNGVQASMNNAVIENTIRVKDLSTNNQFISKEFRGNETDISLELNDKKSFDLLKKMRGMDTLDSRESNTFHSLDSIIKRDNIDKKIKLVLALTKGYVKLGKINLSINDLVLYNRHEGLRLNLAGETNYELNKKFYLNGYLGYGFGDQEFKYGGGVRYVLDHYRQVQISMQYQNDVFPIGREFNELNNSIVKFNHIAHLLFFDNYYKAEKITMALQSDIYRHLSQKIFLQISQVNPFFNYTFQNTSMDNLTLFNAGIKLHFYPKTNYITTSEGKFPVSNKPTHFLFNYTFHLPSNRSLTSFHTAELEARTSWNSPIGGSEMNMMVGGSSSNTPIFSLFEGLGASPRNHDLISSFALGSYRHFVTMQPSSFYSNYYSCVFFTHNLPSFRISEKRRIYLALCYKAILGGLNDPSNHSISLISPAKLYQETGLEINKIFTQLGLGIFYRVGAYQLDGIQNNLAGRLLLSF